MEDNAEFEEAKATMRELIHSRKSAMMATSDNKGMPNSSYAPIHFDGTNRFYCYVSRLARHTVELKRGHHCSLMFIEDEAESENLFARKRVTFSCDAALIERDSERWNPLIQSMVDRLGETMSMLKDLVDFDLFELTASEGRLVLGFGKAYDVSGDKLDGLSYPGGGGHRRK